MTRGGGSGTRWGVFEAAPKLLALGFPLVIGRLSALVMQATDAWMLGKVGEQAQAALTPAGTLMLIPQLFAVSFLMAVTTKVGSARGADRGRFALTGIAMAAGIGGALLAAMLAAAPAMLSLLKLDPGIAGDALSYVRIAAFSLPMQFAAIAMMNYFIGIERPKIGMAAGIAAAAINAALNYCLIFGKMGAPALGIRGAALGTAISSGILLALMLAAFLRHREANASGIRAAKPDRAATKEIFSSGIGMGIHMGVDTLLWGGTLNLLLAPYGSAPLAASTIILSCIHLLQLPIEGIGEGALTCVANAAGQGDATRMRHYADGAVLLAGLYATICGGLLFAFREDVFRLFSDNQAVIDAGSQVILIVALAQFLSAIDTCYCYSLWAIDDTNVPWMFDVFSCLAIFLGGGLIITQYFQALGSGGVWAADALHLGAMALFHFFRWRAIRPPLLPPKTRKARRSASPLAA